MTHPHLRPAVVGAAVLAALGLVQYANAAEGELVIALPTFSEQTMTPWAGSGQRKTYLDLVNEYLVYLDDNGNAVPGLAESWEMGENAMSWTFHLREGVPFSGVSPPRM